MAVVQAAAQHVPAWKRLGLKLKYAKDEPDTTIATPSHSPELSKKRKAGEELNVKASPNEAKRLKNTLSDSPNPVVDGAAKNNDNLASPPETGKTTHPPDSKSNPSSKTPTLTKRKSVTFAPEAKTTDGDSTKDLYNQWLSSQKADDTGFDYKTAAPALTLHSPLPSSKVPITPPSALESTNGQVQALDNKQKKNKGKKKSTSTTIKPAQSLTSSPKPPRSPAESNEGYTHPALSYLTEHHDSPSTWKFSKNHQKYLLKNLFTLENLPSTYDPALKFYLAGLKGLSARQTVRDAALKDREENEMWLSDMLAKGKEGEWEKKRRREAYEASWKREKERLEDAEDAREWEEGRGEYEWKLRKRRRAEQVLGVIGEAEALAFPHEKAAGSTGVSTIEKTNGSAGGGVKTSLVNGGPKQPQKKKRKRKRRTTGVPDDDESSSSSSSSSSDSDSEDEQSTKLRKALNNEKAQALRKVLEERKSSAKSTPSSGIGGSATTEDDQEVTSSDDSERSSGSSRDSEEGSEDERGSVSRDSSDEESHSHSSSSSGGDSD